MRPSSFSWLGLVLAVLALGASAPASAQGVTTAAMNGTVVDAAGNGLPGATVLALHEPSGTRYGVSTRVDGQFNLRNMRVGGPYTVTASFVGFDTDTRSNLTLQLSQDLTVNFELSETAVDLGEAVVATGFPYRRGELANSNLGNFGRVFYDVRGVRRMGSAALDLAYVAAGRLDGFWELHLSPFDLAAGAGLILEAGGVVTDLERGDDWLRGGHMAAGPAPVVEALLARVHARPDGAGERP